MSQLDLLAQHRNAILLAEAIGWLHDYRKCSDEQLQTQAANFADLGSPPALPRNSLAKNHPDLTNTNLQLPVQSTSRAVTDLLDDNTWDRDLLGKFLSRCHNTAHFDKQYLEKDYGKQNYPTSPSHPRIQISSPFGFEINVARDLTRQPWSLPWNKLTSYSGAEREKLRKAVEALFSRTIADTRRPINEVDLWSWGLLVGALYKSALAGALLSGNTPDPHDLRWRLLWIRVDGLDYLLKVARIPDLLARHELITDSLDRVRGLLGTTYPLGSEVYRDEDGSIYVVPDLSDLLERTDSSGTGLRTLIMEAFEQGTLKSNPNLRLGGELVPHLELEQTPWWGQDPDYMDKTEPNRNSSLFGQAPDDELPKISAILSSQVVARANADEIRKSWQNGTVEDICTVCGLRPQGGPDTKAGKRNVCEICEKRRADRSEEWATSQPDKTIWTDEVADANGLLALIVGQFDLTHWLDGNLLQSLLLIAPHDPQSKKRVTSKSASFSRLRRIWETTRCFWQEAQTECSQQLTDDRLRLRIFLRSKPDLGPFHIYDLELGATDLSVVWVPPRRGNEGYLLSADNLGFIARQLGAKAEEYREPDLAAIFVEDYLCKQFAPNGRQPVLRNPDVRAGQGDANLLAGISIARVDYQDNQYATAIRILAEPRTFMAIVPADKSLSILRRIKAKYEREMGKVRDRLPMHLGIVYASRRTPVRAILDAGRAMLDYRTSEQRWTVKSVNGQMQANAAHFEEVELELECGDHPVTWRIPVEMGDRPTEEGDGATEESNKATEDRWYPYFFLETRGDDDKADAPNRRAAKVTRPIDRGRTEDCWVVHAADLRTNDVIYSWPSTFDFEFLDSTARRFEIHYDRNGRRPRHTRPFYLEDLDRLEMLWDLMRCLAVSQRYQVIHTIEATRETWYGHAGGNRAGDDEVFRQFVSDTLGGAAWPPGYPWGSIPSEQQGKLIAAGVSGELTDLAELHMEILREWEAKQWRPTSGSVIYS